MRWLAAIALFSSLANAQERVVVSNAANPASTGVAAAGSILSVALIPDFHASYPLQLNDVGVTILPNGERYAWECGILPQNLGQFTNPLQILALLPPRIPLGPGEIRLYHDGVTVTAPITIVQSNVGLFTPAGAFTVQQAGADEVQHPNQLTHPAQPGDTVTVLGTGAGTASQVTVFVGGITTTSSAVGPAPGMPGVDEIQFVVPTNSAIPNDCYLAIAAQTPGITSNTITISKTADGSPCQSALGLTATDLATLDAGGTVGLAQLSMSARLGRPLVVNPRQEWFNVAPQSAGFTRTEFADFMLTRQTAAGVAAISGPVVADQAFYGCTNALLESMPIGLVAFPNSYDFGSTVRLTSPGGTLVMTGQIFFNGSVNSPAVSDPSQLPPPLFAAGTETFAGSGGSGNTPGAQVGDPFSLSLTLPPEILATNFAALQTINRQRDLVVMWNPPGYGPQDVLTVRIGGAESLAPLYVSPLSRLSVPVPEPLVTCRIPATSGQIVIPAAMLQSLAASGPRGAPAASITLTVSQRSGHTETFALPLSDGASLPGVLQFTSSESWPVVLR